MWRVLVSQPCTWNLTIERPPMTDWTHTQALWGGIAAAALAVLFAHASAVKAHGMDMLYHHLAGYGVPQAVRAPVAYGVVVLEFATAMALLSPWRSWGAWSAFVLLLVYALAMAVQLCLHRVIDCGCGSQALPVSWTLVQRNALLALVARSATEPVTLDALGGFDFFVVTASVLLSVVLYAALHQVLFHQALMRQRLFSGSV